MNTIQVKLSNAQEAFDAALTKLQQCRQTYEQGSGKVYADLMARQADLRDKIARNEAEAETATAEFKQLLSAAAYEKTKPVKDALNRKNDALSIAEELRTALLDVERATVEPMMTASTDGMAYVYAHDKAYAAYAHLQAYQAIAECADSMARAIALVSHVSDKTGLDQMSGDAPAYRVRFIWHELQELACGLPESDRRPEVPELGRLNLGMFANRQFLSPVDTFKLTHPALQVA
jgi:hypothetical protein